jgi:hypothetical protein
MAMVVVGTGRYPGLDRMVEFLSGVHDAPIKPLSYDVFQIGEYHEILARELTEPAITPKHLSKSRAIEELCSREEKNGTR